jgi:hypothetical protein
LNLLELFLIIVFEAGDITNKHFRSENSDENKFVFEALTRLHAKACQVSLEILTLLRSGYADGAHARWRSLHELAVIGTFIANNGNDLAEKYILHEAVESLQIANQYNKYYEKLGEDSISLEEYQLLKSNYDKLLNRFGDSYKNDYGWAASLLNKKRPTFSDIEESINLDHYRPYYKMASHNIHADTKGIYFRLGLLNNSDNSILLAGPSNYGLTDPATEWPFH